MTILDQSRIFGMHAASWRWFTASVTPFSRSSSDSPMQSITLSPAANAFSTLAPVSSSVSPYLLLRSEWPMSVQPKPHSAAISDVHSPVKAPAAVLETFWTPTSKAQPERPSRANPPCSAVGKITASHFVPSKRQELKAAHNSFTVATEAGLLFQFPPTIFLRSVVGFEASRAVTPGSSFPSRSSREAPPPVLQCETFSSVLYFLQAVAVSPPPMIVTAPVPVTFTMVFMSSFVPASNFPISKTPMGPFQMIVLQASTAAEFFLIDSGPQSRAMKPSGTPAARSEFLISPSSPNFEEHTKSTGSTISTPFAFAFSMISGTIFAPSSS
mmetsp:Transcript_21014/g.43199  ORF Transcript_21014/g.43199 Transcript_21014/m.43199 type:complete len:327 (+) Transcript_21014:367-1347(+)